MKTNQQNPTCTYTVKTFQHTKYTREKGLHRGYLRWRGERSVWVFFFNEVNYNIRVRNTFVVKLDHRDLPLWIHFQKPRSSPEKSKIWFQELKRLKIAGFITNHCGFSLTLIRCILYGTFFSSKVKSTLWLKGPETHKNKRTWNAVIIHKTHKIIINISEI